jgi:nitroimidazol reductase NimA-like FMN-containing flavoprotein (pyridoxamine 5'-phosphate oxidase superfamily)
MLIQEMTRQQSLDLLTRTGLCRLGCTQGSQPYVMPFYFAYNNNSLYSASTVGQKIDWMRRNPVVACRRVTITRLRASKLSWPLATKSCSPSNSSPT